MQPSKHQFTRASKERPGDFAPFFEWADTDHDPPVYPLPEGDLLARISDGCEQWLSEGGSIVRYFFGVKTVNVKRSEDGRIISAFYETLKHCCPLAPLLNGLPSNFNPLADAVRLLGADQYWVIGFVHGIDKTTAMMTGKRSHYFEDSLTYVEGREAGLKIGAKFIGARGGWEL